jgi:transcription elongation factor GreA
LTKKIQALYLYDTINKFKPKMSQPAIQRVQMTPLGYGQLVEELKRLETVGLAAGIDRVAKAREFGDLSENSEYHSAREDLAALEGRIEELRDIISRVTVVDIKRSGEEEVGIGSVVMVGINGKEHEFSIVGEWEADPAAKKISHESPLGKALIGKKVGEIVEVEAPAGKVTYSIKSVK